MAEPPAPFANAHLLPRGPPTRVVSDSPTRQRGTDDLLSNLNPRSAVEAFRNPSGALKECMDLATPAEQAFAMRAAIASTRIQEWLDELMAWPWPSKGGSVGFEPAVGAPADEDVARYERRIEEIERDMEELDVEEIKHQVLHNHIMPLSRPGSPMSDMGYMAPPASLSDLVMMNDFTALVTATIIKALPNLSRLTKWMNVWSVRLLVLRRVPGFLDSLGDGEVAVRSGWGAIRPRPVAENKISNGASRPNPSTLSREEFGIIQPVIERRVAKAGRDLDAMLDLLEGLEDTLPEKWVTRVDALEEWYREWVLECEKTIREADWVRTVRSTTVTAPATTTKSEAEDDNASSGSALSGDATDARPSLASTPPLLEEGDPSATDTNGSSEYASGSGDGSRRPGEASETLTSVDMPLQPREASVPPRIKVHLPDEPTGRGMTPHVMGGNGAGELGVDTFDGPWTATSRAIGKQPEVDADDMAGRPGLATQQLDGGGHEGNQLDQFDVAFDSDDDFPHVPEPELPTLPRPRRDSDVSTPSTIVYGLQSGDIEFSSDRLAHGTPEMPRFQDDDMRSITSDDLSLESSPQDFRSSTRSLSVSFNDMPTVVEIPDDESTPRTPLGSSFVMDDDVSRDVGSSEKTGAIDSDEQLQQQISEILESVPAKIRLTSDPSAINLNPPDFTMPTRKPAKPDPYPRSHSNLSTVSNMSSRAGTPSFTLAPAHHRNSRARHQQRANQEIKVYHLSRSNGEAPIKLFIRCVGERNERVMVRVGGGWADLGEYLKEYASHHRRRSGNGKVEVKDLPSMGRAASTPPTRPASAQEARSPVTPLNVRKIRRSAAADEALSHAGGQPKTPLATVTKPEEAPSSNESTRSRSSSRLSWPEEGNSLGMAGPRAKQIEMTEEGKAWVDSVVKETVRIASGERKANDASTAQLLGRSFGEIGTAGATKRLFRKAKHT